MSLNTHPFSLPFPSLHQPPNPNFKQKLRRRRVSTKSLSRFFPQQRKRRSVIITRKKQHKQRKKKVLISTTHKKTQHTIHKHQKAINKQKQAKIFFSKSLASRCILIIRCRNRQNKYYNRIRRPVRSTTRHPVRNRKTKNKKSSTNENKRLFFFQRHKRKSF